jgi:hypothetical protein
MPLKKLPYAQRIERLENYKFEYKLGLIHDDLIKANNALKQDNCDAPTWKWLALEHFKNLQCDEFPQKNKLVIREKNIALSIARKAQIIINFPFP